MTSNAETSRPEWMLWGGLPQKPIEGWRDRQCALCGKIQPGRFCFDCGTETVPK